MGLLAPLWWMWYATLYVCSSSWTLAALVAAVSSLYMIYRHGSPLSKSPFTALSSRPKTARVEAKHSRLVEEIRQVMPIHPHNGWSLDSVSHGVRLFSRFFPSLGVANTPCLAATTIISVPPKKLLSVATNGRDLPCWLVGVTMVPQYILQPRGTHPSDGDIIQLSIRCHGNLDENARVQRTLDQLRRWWTHFVQKYASFLDGLVPSSTQFFTETFVREWSIDTGGCGQVCWVARQPSQLPYHWSMLLFNGSVKEKGQTIATLVMLPRSSNDRPLTSDLLTSHLVALKDFACLRRAKIYPHSSASSSNPPSSDHMRGEEHAKGLFHTPPQGRRSRRENPSTFVAGENPLVLVPNGPLPKSVPVANSTNPPRDLPQQRKLTTQTSSASSSSSSTTSSTAHNNLRNPPPSLPPPPPPPSSLPLSPLASRYQTLGQESCQRLVQTADANEQDGWTPVGTNKDVFVMKKKGGGGASGTSVNCVRGTGIVRAPPEFVFRVLQIRENHAKLDDMLREARLIDQVSMTTRLVHLLYKPVWPTSARDFTVVIASGRWDDTTYVDAAVSVVDPRLPEEKGYVRGKVVCGGYVIRSITEKPGMSEVTYISQAELKGNLPTFAVNKVTESQPMCVATLRTLAEEAYTTRMNDAAKMKELEETIAISPVSPMTPSTSRTLNCGETTPTSPLNPTQTPPTQTTPTSTPMKHTELAPPDTSTLSEGGGEEEMGGVLKIEGEMEGEEEEERAVGVGAHPVGVNKKYTTGNDSGITQPNGTDTKEESWALIDSPPTEIEVGGGGGRRGRGGDGLLVMEALRTYTPDVITSEEEEEVDQEEEERDGEEGEGKERVHKRGVEVQRIRFEKKLQPYPLVPNSISVPGETESLSEESISFPRQESGGVDFRTLGNQTAARVLEELFHVSGLDIGSPMLFDDGVTGWKVIDVEKDVVILKKKSLGSPFHSFMGRGVISLPPRKVYDSIRNPQLRFTYDNMLKELHFVKHIEDGLYILHVHHETMQCFIRQSRDFCILANEREEGDKLLLVGMSVDIPECPVNPNITRAKVTYSGWVIEPHGVHNTHALVTYLLQVDLGGIPATLVNYVSKRQPLAIAYLRDYLISTNTPG